MEVFAHHLYEYNKGVRRLVLYTTKAEHEVVIVAKLERRGIAYILQNVTEDKINVYFGVDSCIEVLKSFPHLNLTELGPDEDFILGAMLGYDMKVFYSRYLRSIEREPRVIPESELVIV